MIFIRERIFFFFKEINQYRKWEIEIIKAHIAGVQRSLKETRERGRESGVSCTVMKKTLRKMFLERLPEYYKCLFLNNCKIGLGLICSAVSHRDFKSHLLHSTKFLWTVPCIFLPKPPQIIKIEFRFFPF